MQELKFQAYIKSLHIVAEVRRINFDYQTVEVALSNGETDLVEYNFDEVEIMQYTGVKDKKGNKIYEGDVIEGGYINPLTKKFESKQYLIEYIKSHYKGKLIGHSPYGDTWLEYIEGEIVGNIYQNKELLEV